METVEQVGGEVTASQSIFDSEYLTPQSLAKNLDVSVRTLDRWHVQRIGPPRTTIGRTVLYRKESVTSWLRSREKHEPRSRRSE
jgi:hypothetical protein